MNETQIRKALALGKCTFLPGSYQKRFAGNMEHAARHHPEQELSKKQADYLEQLFHMYRKQIGNAHNQLCDCKEAKQARAQTKIPQL